LSVEWIGDFEQRFQDAWSSDQADHPLVLMSEDIEYRDDALAEDDARSRRRPRGSRRGLESVPGHDLWHDRVAGRRWSPTHRQPGPSRKSGRRH